MNAIHGLIGRFQNLSIATKLACSSATLVIGLVVVVFVGSNGMSSMTAVHKDVVNVGDAKQLAAETARGDASDVHYSQTLYVLDRGTARGNYVADRQRFQGALNRLIALSGDATDKPLIEGISSAVAGFDRGDARIWALVRTGQSAAAVKLVEGAQNTAADTLTSAFRAY